MTARAVLDTTIAAGFRLESRGEKLHIEPAPPPELLEQLRKHKAEIIGLLAPAEPVAWVDRPDVVAVVEDLADEGMRPGRISRELRLRRHEVLTIMRRSGR